MRKVAFCRDIPSHEKNPDPEGKKSRKIPNPGDFARNSVIEIPKLRKIPNPGDFARNSGIKIPKLRKIPNPGN